jgi:hypothetical protein
VLVGGELKGIATVGTREIVCWRVVNWKGVGQMGKEKLSGGGCGELKGSGTDRAREIECWWVVNWKGDGQIKQEEFTGEIKISHKISVWNS